ncbi:MAG TPA: penicillin-binding transpeptidase domain-containing protein [Myxococcota bacterium]|nr:penicillin-binding transpeptidase domain-containing protein [Myxococcota bacterium]
MRSDLWAELWVALAPALLLLAAAFQGDKRRWLALAGGAVTMLLMIEAALLLPDGGDNFVAASGPLFGDAPRWTLAATGVSFFVWLCVVPKKATWVLACLLCGCVMTIVPYAAVAFGGASYLADGVAAPGLVEQIQNLAAGGAGAVAGRSGHLARLGVAMAFLGGLVSGKNSKTPRWQAAATVACGALPLLLLSGSPVHALFAALVGGLGFVFGRKGFALVQRITAHADTPWARVLVFVFLLGVVGLGVVFVWNAGSEFLGYEFTRTGWLRQKGEGDAVGSGFLPMTAAYVLLPLAAAVLLHRHSKRIWLADLAVVLLMGVLLAQRETGLTMLVFLAWPVARFVRPGDRRLMVGLWAGAVVVVLALAFASTASPLLWEGSGELRERWSPLLSASDLASFQVPSAEDIGDFGFWGLGLREPGAWFAVSHWGTDMAPHLFLRIFGLPGLGIVVAAALPGIAALECARQQAFHKQHTRADLFAVFATTWGVMVTGGVLVLAAGAFRIAALSGVTLGFIVPGLNHFIWALPAFGWLALASVGSSDEPRRGAFRRTLAQPLGALCAAGMVLLVLVGWRRLDTAEPVVLPAEGVSRLRVERGEDGSLVVATFISDRAFDGPVHSGPLILEAEGGVVQVTGLNFDAGDLLDGATLGSAGRFSPPSFVGGLPVSNTVWIEEWTTTRWRELVFGWSRGPNVRAAATGGDISVLDEDGLVACRSAAPDEVCELHRGQTVVVGVDRGASRGPGSYQFEVVGVDGLQLAWNGPAWSVPEGGLLLGGRDLGSRLSPTQIWHETGTAMAALLGQYGGLVEDDGHIARGPRPDGAGLPAGEQELAQLAGLLYDEAFVDLDACTAFRRDPRSGALECVDAGTISDWAVRDGAVLGVVKRESRLTSSVRHPEERRRRGHVYDRMGTDLHEPDSRTLKHPSLVGLVGTYAGGGSYSGLERSAHRVLGGLESVDFFEESARRWRAEPRPPGADIVLTIDLEIQASVAEHAAEAALEVARRRGVASVVNAVVLGDRGEIRAAVTAVGHPDGTVDFPSWSGTGSDGTELPTWQPMGRVRALGDVYLVGSTVKPFLYALHWSTFERIEAIGGGLWIVGSDGRIPRDTTGVLERVDGANIADCHNLPARSGGRVTSGRFELVKAIVHSENVPACYVAAQLGPKRLEDAFARVSVGDRVDLFEGLDDDLDAQLLRRSNGLDALTGRIGLWTRTPTSSDAAKVGQGQFVRLSALGLASLAVPLANGGFLWTPTLLEEVRHADGRSDRPGGIAYPIFTREAAAGVLGAMQDVDEDGTAWRAWEDMDEGLREKTWVKTGTANQKGRASNKSALAITDVGGERIVIAVIVPDAGSSWGAAALEIVQGVVEDRAAPYGDAGEDHATR